MLGILIANWRHAVIAALGALVAVLLASHVGAPGDMINSGFIGFNAVLAAVATYELVAADLRLVFLAAMASTWIFSFINRSWPSPALASGFVLTVWGIMLLGWLNSRFNPGSRAKRARVPVVAPEIKGAAAARRTAVAARRLALAGVSPPCPGREYRFRVRCC